MIPAFARRHPFATAAALAVVLVVGRSAVWLLWEQSYFDSDQAITGLMAKHLAEGRAFPLVFYGQHYMLAVEAWMVAPVFRLFGVSVATLKLPLLLVNVAIAVLLIRILARDVGLSAWSALVASLFFVIAPPVTASRLLEAQGANVEPLLYVLLLWTMRRQAVAFGLIAGVGFLHREFTAYAVVAILLLEWWYGHLWSIANLRRKAIVFAEMAVVFLVERQLLLRADLLGPGTGGTLPANVTTSPISTWTARFCWNPTQLVPNIAWLFRENLSTLFGWRVAPLADYVTSGLTAGHRWALAALLLLAAAAGAAAVRAIRDHRVVVPRRDAELAVPGPAFAGYLILVGILALGVYALASCLVQDRMLIRYTLLGLFVPVGVAAWLFRTGSPALKMIAAVATILWATASGVDTARLLTEYVRRPPANLYRGLADFLERRGVKYARGPYWTAYQIDFLTNERVIVGSYQKVRITEYEEIVNRHRDKAVTIYFDDFCKPTEDGVNLLRWCVGGISRVP